ncbi:hypothetical protein BRADI_3g37495v3 [Brachypodium distachyon]|uniref:Uncharacterized protein n=1 Tax=Brachypodium distachyon TaxID=15368 RepID=A0A2K2D1U1_BRADI|nr:hypothetical protein BRADI_3g37495v3 [Brachypodium distachyon]
MPGKFVRVQTAPIIASLGLEMGPLLIMISFSAPKLGFASSWILATRVPKSGSWTKRYTGS